MAGIIAVYALVISVLLASNTEPPPNGSTSLFTYVCIAYGENGLADFRRGFLRLGAGLSVGLTGLAAGYAIGIVGDVVGRDDRPLFQYTKTYDSAGSPFVHATITNFRRHGSDPYFRRSTGTLWVHASFRWRWAWLTSCRLIVALILNTTAQG